MSPFGRVWNGHVFDAWPEKTKRSTASSIMCGKCGLIVHQADGRTDTGRLDAIDPKELRTRGHITDHAEVYEFRCP